MMGPRVAARYGNTDYFTRRSTDNLADYVKERRQGAEKIFAIFFNEETGRALRERLSLVEGVTVTASASCSSALGATFAAPAEKSGMVTVKSTGSPPDFSGESSSVSTPG